MRQNKILLLAIALIFTAFASAQNHRITGVVKSSDSTGFINGATVTLQNRSDSSGSKSTLTDSLGRFRFTDLGRDSFRVIISDLGYGTSTIDVAIDSADKELGTIMLAPTSDVLSSVTVTASVAPVVQKG